MNRDKTTNEKRVRQIVALLFTLCLIFTTSQLLFADELVQIKKTYEPMTFNPTRNMIVKPYTDDCGDYPAPQWEFVTLPDSIMTSYYDYMPFSYRGFHIMQQTENGDSWYMTWFGIPDLDPSTNRRQYYAEIGADSVAEIAYVEIISPINAGVPEDLDHVYLVVDGTSTQDLVNLSGRDDISTNPPRRHVYTNDEYTEFVKFGTNIVDSLNEPIPNLANTTVKVSNRVTVITQAGGGGVTQDYRIRLWGYQYDQQQLALLPTQTMPGEFTIRDRRNDRDISVPKNPIDINIENWSLLPGGVDQRKPSIMPFVRFATNSNATTVNTRYEFRFDTGNVDDEFKDLEFNYDIQNRLFIPKGLGARAHANSRFVWLRDTGDDFNTEVPEDRFTVLQNRNPIIFGSGDPQWPANIPLYYPIPTYGVTDHILYRTRAVVACQDNGAAIPADGIAVALYGKQVDFGGKI